MNRSLYLGLTMELYDEVVRVKTLEEMVEEVGKEEMFK